MNRGILSSILALTLFCAACNVSPAYQVSQITPDVDGTYIMRSNGNLLLDGSVYPAFSLDIQRFSDRENNHSFQLIVRYKASHWFFIEKGESLVLLVDGKQLAFSTNSGSLGNREALYDGNVSEAAWYDVNAENLRQISRAEEVRLKIKGSKFEREFEFSDGNFKHFRRFVADFVSDPRPISALTLQPAQE